jgi:trigger factor
MLELQRSGFNADQVREMINLSRRNAQAMTIQALREHFILEKIAEEHKIEPSAEQYEAEIQLIAEQSEMSPRKIRTRLEKTGQMDALRNQIIERQVIELVTKEANVSDYDDPKLIAEEPTTYALDNAVAPAVTDIPEAKFDNDLSDSKNKGSAGKVS